MTDIQKREALKQVYPNSRTWPARVDRMSEAQVVAVYNRLINAKMAVTKRLKNIESRDQ